MTDLDTIFTHFSPHDIEEFYQLYQLWSLKQKRAEILTHINELEQQITENGAHFQAFSPSAIAQAALSQFRAVGVDDIDLLDRMLERGDEWLDHALQLFEYCERLNMLQGDTTEWCTHALEGAYEWIESMPDNTNEKSNSDNNTISAPSTDQLPELATLPTITEADFLQKLMIEDGENTDVPQPDEPDSTPRQTAPLVQPLTDPAPPSHKEQKRASRARKLHNISSQKQKKRHKKLHFNQYHRKHKKYK